MELNFHAKAETILCYHSQRLPLLSSSFRAVITETSCVSTFLRKTSCWDADGKGGHAVLNPSRQGGPPMEAPFYTVLRVLMLFPADTRRERHDKFRYKETSIETSQTCAEESYRTSQRGSHFKKQPFPFPNMIATPYSNITPNPICSKIKNIKQDAPRRESEVAKPLTIPSSTVRVCVCVCVCVCVRSLVFVPWSVCVRLCLFGWLLAVLFV